MMCRTSIFALLAAAMTFAAEGVGVTVNASVDSRIDSVTVSFGSQSMGLSKDGGEASWTSWEVGNAYSVAVTGVATGYTAKWKVSTNNVEALSGGTNNTITIPSTSFSGCALHFYGEPNTYNATLNQQSGSGGSSGVTATYDAPMPSATMPTRTGYTFDGYFTAANGGGTKYYNADGTSARAWNIASNATLYAKWTVNTYTVQFDQQSGSGGTASVEATYDSDMPAITLPARDGYTFGGYYTAANGGGTKYYGADGTSARTWNIGEPRTLYAKWTEAAFTVALDPQGGSGGTESVTATYGRALPSVAKPMRGGYKFNGYYAEVNGGGMQYYTSAGSATTNSLFTSDATIYAYWTLNPTVTFELNGGAFKDGSAWTTVTNYEEGVGLPSLPTGLDITYANHAFDGWYENGSTKEVKSIGPTATGDKTLSAKWVEESYWVTFVANDASGHSGELRLPMANPESLTPVSKLFSREGYSFVEWNTRSDGSGESYVDQAQITPANSLTNVPDARVILYAQWAPNPYEVAFLPNGADGGEPMPNQSFTYDVTQNLNAVEFTYTGYVFKEWSSTNHDNQTMHYTDGEAVVNLATGGVVNLYANWTGVVYTVSFNANGGEGQMEPESISCVYNMPTNLPACRFERDGWGFKGWTTNGADDVLFADRARVTNLTATAGAEVALLACWTGVTYSVTLDARDPRGDGLMVNDDGEPVSVLIGSYTVGDAWDLPTPTNGNGHLSFVGWTYEDAQGRVKDVPGKVPPPSHGITNLMASWSWVPDDFAVAVDAEELPFRTFGTAGPLGFPDEPSYDANWFVQTQFVYTDGELDRTNQTAVQSGALPEEGAGDYYATWLTTTVTGAGVLSFQWKWAARERYQTIDEFDHSNDGDSGDAFLFGRCNADGSFTALERREGTSDGWEKVVYTNNSAEAVTFAWAFQFKSGDVGPNGEGRGGGTGWVDRVTWTPEGGGNSEPPDSGETQEMWTVTFDANGGEGAAMATQTFTNGVEQALSPNAFTRTGYTFGGWATNAMGGVVYTNCQSVAIATNTMLYASWTTNTYTVTFNANGGSEVAPITRSEEHTSELQSRI